MHIQKKVKGGRVKQSASVHKRIRQAVEHTSRKFNVSMSYVQDTALAEFFGIEYEELVPYYEVGKPKRAKLRRVK